MIFRGKSLRDVSRAAKKGAIGAATSGVLRTAMGTTGGGNTKRLSKAKVGEGEVGYGGGGGPRFAPEIVKKEGRQRKDKRARMR